MLLQHDGLILLTSTISVLYTSHMVFTTDCNLSYPGETIEKLTEMIQPCHETVTWSYDFWNIMDMNCHLKAGQQTINKLMAVSCQKMTSKIYNFLSSYLHALMVNWCLLSSWNYLVFLETAICKYQLRNRDCVLWCWSRKIIRQKLKEDYKFFFIVVKIIYSLVTY